MVKSININQYTLYNIYCTHIFPVLNLYTLAKLHFYLEIAKKNEIIFCQSLCKNTQKFSKYQIFSGKSTKKLVFPLIFSGLLVLLHY